MALPLADTDNVSTFDADGRVLAEDLISSLDVPGHDNSSMDGYAVRSADLSTTNVLQVTQRIPAGSIGHALEPLAAARIFTGAPIPPGADAVVMQEDTEALTEGASVRLLNVPKAGQWIRRQGEDVARGAVVLACGQRLSPDCA